MNYNSLRFLIFVLSTTLLYFIFPKKARWTVLLFGSCVYYWLNNRILCLALLTSASVTYGCARFIDSPLRKNRKKARTALTIGIFVNLCLLIGAKYINPPLSFLYEHLSSDSRLLPPQGVLIPLGISFYTLQTIAYLSDVYRGKVKAEKNYFHFLLFVLYFPQLLQGPIMRYNELAPQLFEPHPFRYSEFTNGAQLVLWGYMKKLILADRIAPVIRFFFDINKPITGSCVFFGAVLYSIQIYADFSGGIDISRGVSQMFGIRLSENFRQPYFSRSVAEFWRRWHISLGAWMREYVFYPLSLSNTGNKLGRALRKGGHHYAAVRVPAVLSMGVVWALVGLWHGPEAKYLVYGVWNDLFISLSILFRRPLNRLTKDTKIQTDAFGWKTFQILRTFLICTFGRYFVLAPNVPAAFTLMKRSFQNLTDFSWLTNRTLLDCGLNQANWIVVIAAVFLLFFADCLHEKGVNIRKQIASLPLPLRWSIYIISGLALLIFGIYGPGYDPAAFIYGQL